MILGAGGQARVVANIAALLSDWDVVGCADSNPASLGERIGATKVIATYDDMPKWRSQGITHVVVALGNNEARERLVTLAEAHGLESATLIHPTAIIDTDASVGPGSVICTGAILATEARIGRGCIVNTGSIVEHECVLEDFAQVCPGCRIAGRAKIGRGAFIGTGACILPGLSVGNRAQVGAGAVVIEDVPAGITVVSHFAKARGL